MEKKNQGMMGFLLYTSQPAEFLKWNNPPSIFGTVHYFFRDIKIRSWSASSIEPGQTARIRRLAWLYTGGKG